MKSTDLWIELGNTISNEKKFRIIKQYRDDLLARSDWTQLPDAILDETQRAVWQDYRQVLRDIPQTFANNPDDAIFPERPQ